MVAGIPHRMPMHSWYQGRCGHQSFAHQGIGLVDVAHVEHFQLGLDVRLPHAPCRLPRPIRRVEERSLTQIERPGVQGTNVRAQPQHFQAVLGVLTRQVVAAGSEIPQAPDRLSGCGPRFHETGQERTLLSRCRVRGRGCARWQPRQHEPQLRCSQFPWGNRELPDSSPWSAVNRQGQRK